MNELVTKLQSVEDEVTRERGGILFFGLLKTAELPDKWDLVISARWVTESKLSDLRYLAEKLRARLTPDEMISLARIVLLEPKDTILLARGGLLDLRPGALQLIHVSINEMTVTHAYIITSDGAALHQAVAAGAAVGGRAPQHTPIAG
jgi:hypothetical protein